MSTFIATTETGIVEFDAESLEKAKEIADEHGFTEVREVEIALRFSPDTSVDEVIEVAKASVDKIYGSDEVH